MRTLLFLLAVAPMAATASAQDTALRSAAASGLAWWADVSGGVEAAPLFAGFGAHVSGGRQFALRLGIDSSVELTLGADPTSVHAVSLGGGIRARRGRVHLGAYAGPALVWGLDRFDVRRDLPRTREPYVTAGVALNGSAVVEVGAGVGLGLDVSSNVNPEVSTVGGRLTTHVRLNRAR